jgi:hypothetical protein
MTDEKGQNPTSFLHAQRRNLSDLCKKIVEDVSFRAEFQSAPLKKFEQLGVPIPHDFRSRAEGKSLTSFLLHGGDPLSRLMPGEVEVPAGLRSQQAQEPPWVVPVAIVAVAIASTPAVFTSEVMPTEEGVGDEQPGDLTSRDHES